MLNDLKTRLRALFRRRKVEAELDEELRFHLEQQTLKNMQTGMNREEAARQARIEFGGVEKTKEEARDARGVSFIETTIRDVRYGLRQLRRSPGFTVVAILTLALGIGANTAIFSVVYDVLLRPLPYPRSSRLVTPELSFGSRGGLRSNVDASTYKFWAGHTHGIFKSIAAYSGGGFNLSSSTGSQRVVAGYVSSSFFRTLGAQPTLGRTFTRAEDEGTGKPVAILGYALWASHFAGNPHVLGKTVLLDDVPYAVIGVMPRAFTPLGPHDLWIPLARESRPQAAGANQQVVARLKPGIPLGRAQAGMQLLAGEFERTHLGHYPSGFGIRLITLQTFLGMGAEGSLLPLFGAAGFVLLIACANVAGLLVAKSARRSHEIALRQTFGATRWRLVRQLATESGILAILGAAASLPVAYGGLWLLLRLVPSVASSNSIFAQATSRILTHSSGISVTINVWSLLFALFAGMLSAVLFGLLPAWKAVDRDVNETLKAGGSRSTALASRARMRSALVAGEIAITVVLLAGALLLVRTFVDLLQVGPGFDTSHLLSVQLWMDGSQYRTSEALSDFYRSVITRVEELPGARAATVVSCGMPLTIGGNFPVSIETVPQPRSVDYRAISPGYFKTLRVPLLAGREFTSADTVGNTPVVVVNQAFARRYLGRKNPLGLHVKIGANLPGFSSYGKSPKEIVGVAGSTKSRLDLPAAPTIFIPDAQASYGVVALFDSGTPVDLLVRTTESSLLLSQPVRKAVAALDPSVPIGAIQSLDELRTGSLSLQRFMLTLIGIFAGLALVLSAVGIYGVMSQVVVRRTSEIGVRMAVGATPSSVLRMVLGYAGKLATLGIVLGVVAALALTRFLASMLYGVKPTDPLTFFAVSLILIAVALLACYLPARRAMRVDPAVALRHE